MAEQVLFVTGDQSENKGGSPPYIPYLTFKNFINWLDTDGVPYRFDRSAWDKKYSGSTGPQLLTGLRFLRLLDGETPTPKLLQLIDVQGEDRTGLLIEILKEAYDTIDFNALSRATPNMLREWMENYGVQGDTVRKAESFFVNAAKDLEIPMSPSLRKMARNRPQQTKSGVQPAARRPSRKAQELPPQSQTPRQTTPPPSAGLAMEAEAQKSLMLWGLFKRLPAPGSVFSLSEREAWVKAAQTLFDLEYDTDENDSEDYE